MRLPRQLAIYLRVLRQEEKKSCADNIPSQVWGEIDEKCAKFFQSVLDTLQRLVACLHHPLALALEHDVEPADSALGEDLCMLYWGEAQVATNASSPNQRYAAASPVVFLLASKQLPSTAGQANRILE